jgi:hypothetical protein
VCASEGGKWQALQWKKREWLLLNREVVQDFSYEQWYYTVYPDAFVNLYFPVLKSDQYCRYNRIIDMLSKVSCSCNDTRQEDAQLATTSTPCTFDPKILVGVSTLCTGFDYELDVRSASLLLGHNAH